MITLLTRTFSEDEAREVAAWSYPYPFDIYNVDPDKPQLFITRSATGEGYYPAVDKDGTVVAFCVFGAEARVPGQEPSVGTIDVGAGVRPDLTSQGLATHMVGQIVALARSTFDPEVLRTVVATFNERSLALCHRLGFRRSRDFNTPDGVRFRELILTLSA